MPIRPQILQADLFRRIGPLLDERFSFNIYTAAVNALQSDQGAEQRRFTAAGWADDGQDLSFSYGNIDAAQDGIVSELLSDTRGPDHFFYFVHIVYVPLCLGSR